jgi:hypothetical protein
MRIYARKDLKLSYVSTFTKHKSNDRDGRVVDEPMSHQEVLRFCNFLSSQFLSVEDPSKEFGGR